jgi:hypothetical protein
MLCWSCGKELPEDAARCSYCEADIVSLPNEQEMTAAREFLASMDPDLMSELHEMFASSENGEEFVNRLMVGDCPACASSKTGNCEHDPDIDDITIGRCFDCGFLWCTICGTQYEPGQTTCQACDVEEEEEDDWSAEGTEVLDRYHLLAAEIYSYSFANYRDHLGIDNIRYDTLMPNAARTLEQALLETWPLSRVADELELDEEAAEDYLQSCREALQVIDAENPAESFRNAVRISIQRAVNEGLGDEESIEDLVTQICYRAADLAVLLDLAGQPLRRYSRHLRRESGHEYYEGYFDDDEDDVDEDDVEEDDVEEDDLDEA